MHNISARANVANALTNPYVSFVPNLTLATSILYVEKPLKEAFAFLG